MDFQEEILALSRKSKNFGEKLLTEEATKNTLVLPFIKMLGYDPFDPTEVVPEYTAAIGEYKDARVDYAVIKDNSPIIIFECKAYGTELDAKKCNQLMLYFHGTDAKVAILTDGNRYLFYSDLEEPNKMDSKPYMEFILEKPDSALIPELKKLVKGTFNIEDAMTSASVLKYTREFKRVMNEQLNQPDDDFLRFFLKRCYDGQITANVRERFAPVLKDALNLFIKDRVNDRLQSAMESEQVTNNSSKDASEVDQQQATTESVSSDGIETTDDEKQAFFIIKSILMGMVEPEKVVMRDYKGFCDINYIKTKMHIIRLYFNNPEDYKIGIFNEAKEQDIHSIDKLDDIYKNAEQIRNIVKYYIDN